MNVVSATTTKGRLNRNDTPVYELRRLIDSDRKSDLEFEARISGVLVLIESARKLLRRLAGSSAKSSAAN